MNKEFIEFATWDNKYEGRKVRPVDVPRGIQARINNDFEIKCNLKRSQLDNKELIYKIVDILEREGVL